MAVLEACSGSSLQLSCCIVPLSLHWRRWRVWHQPVEVCRDRSSLLVEVNQLRAVSLGLGICSCEVSEVFELLCRLDVYSWMAFWCVKQVSHNMAVIQHTNQSQCICDDNYEYVGR
jgi:hypothetical protein